MSEMMGHRCPRCGTMRPVLATTQRVRYCGFCAEDGIEVETTLVEVHPLGTGARIAELEAELTRLRARRRSETWRPTYPPCPGEEQTP